LVKAAASCAAGDRPLVAKARFAAAATTYGSVSAMSKIFPKRSCQRISGGKAACRTVRPLPLIGAVSVPGDPGAVDDDSVETDGLDHNFVVVDTARYSVPLPNWIADYVG